MLFIDTRERTELLRNLSILFVEDDAEVRETMSRYLARRVAHIHTAPNGVEGISSFHRLHPDIVISDISMKEMDGLTMCRAIRETEPDLPVILISAHNESEMLLSSIDLGVSKFIVKPVDMNVLMESIISVAELLEQQRNQEIMMRQLNLNLNEANYESESVKDYVSRYLQTHHHDELANIKHLNIPKLGVSGDFYSVAKHHDDLYVMLADGAGHGLSAVIPALQMPRVFQQQAARGFSLLTIAAEINRSLHEQHFVGHFVTTTLIRINSCEGFIEVLNCGNPPVFIFDDAGGLLHTIHSESTALGVVSEDSFSAETERFNMNQNARIYLFTDGLTDTLQVNTPELGLDELQAMFSNVRPPDVFDAVSATIKKAALNCKVDDVTLLEIHFDCNVPCEPQVEIPFETGLPVETEIPVALDQMTLLYVEDDELTREYLAHYLNRRMGMVYVAKNGKDGLAQFKKHRPQIVVSDIKMPLMDGLMMAEEIRKLDKEVPIIVTSGSDNAEDAERMFEMGISRFHLKPLDPGKLTNTIQHCIRQAGAAHRLRLSASAFEASSLAVITTDREKRIIAVNPAFCRMTGYTPAEMFGHSPTLLSAGKHDSSHYQTMLHTLDESGSWSGELLCQHKNGETISEWVTVNAVHGTNGVLTGYHFVFSDISERQMNEEKVRQVALHDSLTQLPNRAMFANTLNELLAQAKQRMSHLALINIKIDRIIDINNAFGVKVGDEVIRSLAQTLLNSVDNSDGVFRTGGSEFSIVMLKDGGHETIEQTVIELFKMLNHPIQVQGQQIHAKVNVGVSTYPTDGETHEELIKGASSAMDQAQQAGGGGYRFFDKSFSQHEERQTLLQQHIKSGLEANEFYMLYQPKYSLSQQRVVGAEALVRWNHRSLGLISPVEFIPLAESSGTVIEMSEWIVDSVCAQLAEWRTRGLPQVPVSINISPVHFWRGDLVGCLQSALQKWNINPAMLPIEVTEGVVMDTSDRTLHVLGELKALGFHLSIDDFGTGYSSLKYLKDLPISELKIDRSFIIEIPEEGQPDDLSKTAIPRAIIQLAAELHLKVVAEGVETENQKNFLLKNGCDVIQGYLFSRPVSADEFALLLS